MSGSYIKAMTLSVHTDRVSFFPSILLPIKPIPTLPALILPNFAAEKHYHA